jgi:CubicO group peptidase (beta-lactamase class C family)
LERRHRHLHDPDLRALAVRKTEIVEEPGRRLHYNNFNPLLVGLVLERTTGMPVATYLERKLWQPLGMEADGSWSLDRTSSGFEKMESGLNGRAVDLARFGMLYANGGAWHGRQLVPRSWVEDPTLVPPGPASPPPAPTSTSGGSRTTGGHGRSSPGASMPSTSTSCPTPGWCWSASGGTSATGTGRSCSAIWHAVWMPQSQPRHVSLRFGDVHRLGRGQPSVGVVRAEHCR